MCIRDRDSFVHDGRGNLRVGELPFARERELDETLSRIAEERRTTREALDDDPGHVTAESAQAMRLIALDDAERAVESSEYALRVDVGTRVENRHRHTSDASNFCHHLLLPAGDRVTPPGHGRLHSHDRRSRRVA